MAGQNLRKLSLVPAVALWLAASGAAAQATEFDDWLAEFRVEAAQAGISPGVLDAALGNVKPIPRVIELDRKQPESTQTFEEYLARRVTADLAREGRRLLDKHRALLEAIGEEYGVQPRFVVALWGAETRYGKYTGGFSVIASLATLAYDGRRSKYFRGELLNAGRVGGVDLDEAGEVGRQAHLLLDGERELRDEVAGVWGEDVGAENAVFGVADDDHPAEVVAVGAGAV